VGNGSPENHQGEVERPPGQKADQKEIKEQKIKSDKLEQAEREQLEQTELEQKGVAEGDKGVEMEGVADIEQEQLLAAGWELEKEELLNRLKREKADFANYKRMARTEQENAREYALFCFMQKMLPVLDNMERAIQSAAQEAVSPSHINGLEMIYHQLLQLIEQEGATVIDALGKPFDPYYHHAVARTDEGEGEPMTVVKELARGYIWKDRVLRPSMVVVYQC
jgi:molecular chaperone GrpE